MIMATLSQAEIDAILDALCVGLSKRLIETGELCVCKEWRQLPVIFVDAL